MSEPVFSDDANSVRVFSYADLKRLKELLQNDPSEIERIANKILPVLLARLEAAEKFREQTRIYLEMLSVDYSVGMKIAESIWRKASGKSESEVG